MPWTLGRRICLGRCLSADSKQPCGVVSRRRMAGRREDRGGRWRLFALCLCLYDKWACHLLNRALGIDCKDVWMIKAD